MEFIIQLHKRELESNKIKAEYYYLESESLWRIIASNTGESEEKSQNVWQSVNELLRLK